MTVLLKLIINFIEILIMILEYINITLFYHSTLDSFTFLISFFSNLIDCLEII